MFIVNNKSIFWYEDDFHIETKSKKFISKNFDVLVKKSLESNQLANFKNLCVSKDIDKLAPKIVASIIKQNFNPDKLKVYANQIMETISWRLYDYKHVGENKRRDHFIFLHQLEYNFQQKKQKIYNYNLGYDLLNLFLHSPTCIFKKEYIKTNYLEKVLPCISNCSLEYFEKIYHFSCKSIGLEMTEKCLSNGIVNTDNSVIWDFLIENNSNLLSKKYINDYCFTAIPVVLVLINNHSFNFEDLKNENYLTLKKHIINLELTKDYEYNRYFKNSHNAHHLLATINHNIFCLGLDLDFEQAVNNLTDLAFYKVKLEFRKDYEPVKTLSSIEQKTRDTQLIFGEFMAIAANLNYVLDRIRTYYPEKEDVVSQALWKKLQTLSYTQEEKDMLEKFILNANLTPNTSFKKYKL